VKKLVVVSGGLIAAGSAAIVGAGVAMSQPDAGAYNVIGEPYGKAVQILKSQGIKGTFGGSFGSVLNQSNCLVYQMKPVSSSMKLMLDCSQDAAEQLEDMGPSGGPSVGSNGVTTVTPTPVVPIAGAPGAGTPPPA
jgi:hypothetical protein